jgi:hypothetical protein
MDIRPPMLKCCCSAVLEDIKFYIPDDGLPIMCGGKAIIKKRLILPSRVNSGNAS